MSPADRSAGRLPLAWYALLPSALLRRTHDDGHGEHAWARADAPAVVDVLEARGYRIRSVDPWLPARPDGTDRHWPRPGLSAAAFIAAFEGPPGDAEPVFAVDAELAG